MVWRWLCVALLAAGAAAAAAVAEEETKVRFDGFRVYRVVPKNQEQVEFLQELEDSDGVSFWTRPVLDHSVDVMVSPSRQGEIVGNARSLDLSTSVFIEDVQKLIDEENTNVPFATDFGWQQYYRFADVSAWLHSLEDLYPGIVTVESIGRSYNDQELLVVQISYDPEANNPVIVVESGIHAREWITVASTTYLVNELLTSTDSRIRDVATSFDWRIIPTINPDGYEYTHTHNRLWRKTRTPGPECFGVDGNRNWEYDFHNNNGSSNNSCSETYRGENPFSTNETKALSDYLLSLNDTLGKDLLVYFCIHSYSQVLMIPYGLEEGEVVWDEEELNTIKRIGEEAVKELAKKYNTQYGFGHIYKAIGYEASGGSMDWVKYTLGTKYTYEWELRDTGRYGFLLPASLIIPTAEETLDSMVYILKEVQNLEKVTSTTPAPPEDP